MLIENIFFNLFSSYDYFRVVFPHLNEKYFDSEKRIIFNKIKEYYDKYQKIPKIPEIKLLIETDSNIPEKESQECYDFLDSLKQIEAVDDINLLIKQTEKFCQDRALEIAILDCVEILQNKKESRGSIEEKIKKALAVEFDVKIGMDFFKDAPRRYEKYIEKDEYIPTDIEVLNFALNGGFRKKSLSVFIGKTNLGKTLWLCHLASSFLKSGKNVLYITAEMAEEMIAKRIDANMLDIPINELNENLDKKMFLSKIKEIFAKTHGKLIVKEYPTSSANALHIKNLLNEIRQKRNFLPDILILDYLNIFSSCKLSGNAAMNSYAYVKSIAEEIRAIAVEFNIAVISATQTNRQGASQTTDMTMEGSVSESFGLAMTVDWLGGIIQTPELFEQNKYLLKVLKSRYNDNINAVYTLGVERSKMRLLNLDESQQEIPLHIKDKLKMEKESQTDCSFDFD